MTSKTIDDIVVPFPILVQFDTVDHCIGDRKADRNTTFGDVSAAIAKVSNPYQTLDYGFDWPIDINHFSNFSIWGSDILEYSSYETFTSLHDGSKT